MGDASTTIQKVKVPAVEGVSRSEQPVRFRVGDDEVFGILTEPLQTPRRIGVVLLNATSDRNRFLPRLARRLAAAGFHVMRFDYHGFGESAGPMTGSQLKHAMITLTTLEEPFTNDLLGAVEEFHRRGLEQIVLIGRCFGSRTVLSAVRQIPNLRGVALISLPLHQGGDDQHPNRRWALEEVRGAAQRGAVMRALRGLRNPRRRARWAQKLRLAAGQLLRLPGSRTAGNGPAAEWVSQMVVESVRNLAARRVPTLFVYGRLEPVYKDFQHVQAGPLRQILVAAGDRVTVSLLDGPTNNLTNLKVQEDVMARTQEWLETVTG